MADNAAQAVGKLDERIKELNSDLQDSMSKLAKYDKDIANLFEQVAQNTKIQTDEVVDYISKKLKTIAIKDYSEGLLGTKEAKEAAKAADAYFKTFAEKTEAENRRQLEINKAYNEREMQLAEQREKQKLQIEKVYAQERERLAEAEAKKRMEMEKAWAEHDKQVAASRTDLNKLGDLAATRGLTGNLATLQDTSAYKRYMEERKRLTKQTAQEEAAATKKTNQAIQQQIQYYRQLHTLYKEYKALQAKPNKTEKDNEILEQTKKKMLEILNLSKKLEMENKGSAAIAKQATEWERVRDRAKGAKKEIQENKKSLEDMLPTLRRLASAFGVAFSVRGLVQFGKKLIETRGEFELQQVALRSILQNKQLADEIWDKTMRAALQSPFTAMQLTKYTKQLAAYRIETSKLFDTTKMLADVSAGLGVDMQRLILAYGQVKAANYLRASEIRQFTEAGVNILGELSKYLTDMKGEMVSTAQVMEMVQKRMVTFSDVEAIFKRMTNEGGIFYNMQYIQSQTVKGQIMKLHDAYDQMLNSIGQANEGVLKNMVSLLNKIVKNWREWKTILDLIAWPLIISSVYKFGTGLLYVNAAAISASASVNKLTVAGARLQLAFSRLWATIAKNPMLTAIALVSAAGVAMWNHAKSVGETNKKYEELMFREYETQKKLDDYSASIQKNLDIMANAKKGTKEYNDANKENDRLISQLNNDYPDLLKDIDLQKDGYQKLIEKIKEYNSELEDQIRLEYAARGNVRVDDLATNIADLQEAQRRREMEFLKNREHAEKIFLENGKKDLDYWWKRMRLAKDWAEQMQVIEENKDAMRGGGITLLSQGFIMPGIGGFWGGGVQSRTADLRANIANEALVYNDIIREQLKKINEDLGEDIEAFIDENKKQVDELFKDKEGEGWKLLNSRITKFFKAKGVTDKETQQVIQELLNSMLLVPIQLDWGGTGNEEEQRQQDLESNKQAFGKMIPLIREMRAEYDKLSKSAYNAAVSEGKVRESYAQAVREILSKAGVTEGYDFTTNEGMIEALKKVKAFAATLGAEYAAQVEKYIGQLTAETEINVVVKERKDFDEKIQKLFDNYDLTLNLEKLELPTDELEGIFKFDVTSLDDLRTAVEDYKKEMEGKGHDPKDVEEQIKKYNDKIDDMERKALVNRLKTYTEYLAKGRDEAVKIHLEELRMMAELDELAAEGYYTDTQRKDIADKIKKDTQQKLAKNEWQSFKESDFYVTMFQDLEHVSQVSIDIMLKKLGELREQMKDLDPTQVKEITKSMEKLEKVKLQRSPVAQFFKNKEISKAWDKKGDETLLDTLFGKEEKLKKDKELVSAVVAQAQKDFDDLSQNGTAEDAAEAKEYLEQSQEVLDKINEDLEKTQEEIDEVNKRNNEGYEALKRRQQAMVNDVGYFNQMVDAAMTVNQEMMDMMDGVSDASKKLAKDIAEIATNAGLLAADIVKAIYSEGTDVGAMIDGLIRTWNIIKSWMSARERGANQDIEDQTNALKDLERELDAIQRAREKAWDAQALREYQIELDETLNKQKHAYNAMIKAEESRKNPDEDLIRQWKDAITEIDNMLEDEKEKFMQVFGGIGEGGYRDAASAFVSAWKEAFLETGDGLQGLQDHFNEFLQEWFVKQATMRIAGRMLEPLFSQIDRAVDQYGTGSTSVLMSELNAIREKFAAISPRLSDALEALAGQWGLEGEGGLSGLAAGIQGMTEEQANILEAYWNSVRGYTASIDMNVSRIVELLGAGGVNTNPQLQQLELIARNTGAIQSMFNDVILSGHERGGRGIKVFMN